MEKKKQTLRNDNERIANNFKILVQFMKNGGDFHQITKALSDDELKELEDKVIPMIMKG